MRAWIIVAAVLGALAAACGDYGRHEDDSGVVVGVDGGEGGVDAGPMESHYDPVLGNAFDHPVELDDARVETMDPAGLPEGLSPCRPPVLVRVTRVTDGDTVFVSGVSEALAEHVRLIGIDTPEIAHDGMPADCYGPEADAFTGQLQSREVWLTFDAECRDPYDRLLAYVFVGPGPQDSWQRQLLRRGFAGTLRIPPNDTYYEQFAMDQAAAVRDAAGMWGACP
jgi:micrococcal nuclease